jgi:hypothetical protein
MYKIYFLIAGGRCTSNSCLNGGTCYNTGNDFICLCKPQFSGPTCAMQASVTTPNPTTSSSKYIFHTIMKIILFSKLLTLVHQIHVKMVVHVINIVLALYAFAQLNTQVKYVMRLKQQQYPQSLHQTVRSFIF